MNFKREHPIKIISKVSHFAILLIVPITRALFYLGADFRKWVSGAWIDLLVLFLIVGFGVIAWYFDLYLFKEDGIYKYTGLFNIEQSFTPIDNLTQVRLEQPWYLYIFGAARIRTDSPADRGTRSDFEIILAEKEAVSFFEQIKKSYSPRRRICGNLWSVLGLSILASNGFTGAVYFFALVSQAGKIFGKEFERLIMNQVTNTVKIVLIGLPPATLLLSGLIVAGFLYSLILNIVRYSNFCAERRDNILYIKNGLFIDRHQYFFKFEKINYVLIRQTIITKILSIYSVFLGVVGYGNSKNEKAVLIPAFKKQKSLKLTQTLLPEFKFVKPNIRPHKRNFFRYIFIPFCIFLGIAASMILALFIFPAFSGLVVFAGIMMLAVDALYFVIKIISFFESGVSVEDNLINLSYSKCFVFFRVCFDIDKLVKLTVRQTPMQKRADCCSLIFYIYGNRASKHILPNIDMADARKLAKLIDGEKQM